MIYGSLYQKKKQCFLNKHMFFMVEKTKESIGKIVKFLQEKKIVRRAYFFVISAKSLFFRYTDNCPN